GEVAHHHVVPGDREDLGDAAAHDSSAEHADLLHVLELHAGPPGPRAPLRCLSGFARAAGSLPADAPDRVVEDLHAQPQVLDGQPLVVAVDAALVLRAGERWHEAVGGDPAAPEDARVREARGDAGDDDRVL